MSAATSTIIAGIALGAGTGAQLYGAHRAGKAADKAAQLQSDAADRALAVQQQQHEQTRTDLAPYRGAGESSLSALTAFLGLPPTAAPAAPAAAPAPPAAPTGAPPSRVLPQLQTPAGGGTSYGPGHGYVAAPASQPGSALVMLRAPNGQTKQVPADQVAYYLARGATQV